MGLVWVSVDEYQLKQGVLKNWCHSCRYNLFLLRTLLVSSYSGHWLSLELVGCQVIISRKCRHLCSRFSNQIWATQHSKKLLFQSQHIKKEAIDINMYGVTVLYRLYRHPGRQLKWFLSLSSHMVISTHCTISQSKSGIITHGNIFFPIYRNSVLLIQAALNNCFKVYKGIVVMERCIY